MRIIVAAAVLVASVILAGCFHHWRTSAIEPLPPPPLSNPPYK